MSKKVGEMSVTRDAYQKFFNHFHIQTDELIKWGIGNTIFSPLEKVKKQWKTLLERIFNNEEVAMRGFGRDAIKTAIYIEFYEFVFKNERIKKDPTNNAKPKATIAELTGFRINKDIANYQISHIWGHAKNIFLFEAAWNYCYTPKVMDPFTGHEAKGQLAEEYQDALRKHAFSLYWDCIREYNSLLQEYHMVGNIDEFLEHTSKYDEKTKRIFRKSAVDEFVAITV